MRPALLLVAIAVAVFLLAAAVWLMGNQWAVAGSGVLLLASTGYASRRLA